MAKRQPSVIGIDPGVTGAMAVITGEVYDVMDLPVRRDGKLVTINSAELAEQIRKVCKLGSVTIYCERLHAMPQNGSIAAFSQGTILGGIVSAIEHTDATLELISPNVWKKALALSSDKSQSLQRAREMFPHAPLARQKDHNRAEALLIAHFGMTRESK